jgi:hypothetical protein
MFPRCLRNPSFSKLGFLSGETMFKKSEFFKNRISKLIAKAEAKNMTKNGSFLNHIYF